jgi:hypothetical protein
LLSFFGTYTTRAASAEIRPGSPLPIWRFRKKEKFLKIKKFPFFPKKLWNKYTEKMEID